MPHLSYHHVDVFASGPFSGNSLAVFPDARVLSTDQMLAITQELRHFESIFLIPGSGPGAVAARIFDTLSELDFAGHPLLGAAAVLHNLDPTEGLRHWTFALRNKSVSVSTERSGEGYVALLDQGRPEFLGRVPAEEQALLAAALNLQAADLCEGLAPEVISTGLRYLIVPIRQGLERARIVHPDFPHLLARWGAQFAYLLDVGSLEGRHWNNDGVMEDVATGSAAGTVGAYLVSNGVVAAGQEFVLHQGRFVGRPSRIRVRADLHSVVVGGEVARVGTGELSVLPAIHP